MSRHAAACFGLIALAIVGHALPSGADEGRPIADALHVSPDTCLARETLARAVAYWLQRGEVTESIEFEVRGAGPEVVFITKRSGAFAGERHLRTGGGTCAEVTDAVGLAIALTIDATLLDRIGIETPHPTPVPISSPVPVPIPVPTAVPVVVATPPAPFLRWTLDARALVLVNVMPGFLGGAELAADVSFGRLFELRAGGAWAGGSASSLGSGEIDASLAMGRVDACLGSPTTGVRLRGCVGLLAGAALAQGVGYSPSTSTSLSWLGAAVRLDTRVPLGSHFALKFGIDVIMNLQRPSFDVAATDGSTFGSVRAPAAGLGASFGPSWTF